MTPKVGFAAALVALAALAAGTAAAHHSFSAEFDPDRPVKLTGKVTEVKFSNPHAWLYMDVTGEDGWPEQVNGVVESSPGLYFVGLPFLYSFASMLIGGVGRDAGRVADHILARAQAERTEPEAIATAA